MMRTVLTKFSDIFSSGVKNPALNAILKSNESKRLDQIKNYWRYYNGDYYDYTAQDGELPYVDLCFGMVEKLISWIVGKPLQLKARPDIQGIMGELHTEIMENSGGDVFINEIFQMGGVTGDVFLHPCFDPITNDGNGGIKIKLLDSSNTFVEYRNIAQNRVLSRVMMMWNEADEATGDVKTFLEIWSKEEVRVYPPGPASSLLGLTGIEEISVDKEDPEFGMQYRAFKNPYSKLPFVHIRNFSVANSVYGRSDLHTLWILTKELNEQLLSYKDNVDYHGNPITLLYGVSAKQIEKGANKVWGNIPISAKIENLKVTDTHEAILKYMDMLKSFVGLSNFPYHLTGVEKDILKAETSTAARRMMFSPLEEMADKKRLSYGKGIAEAFEMALIFMNDINGLKLEEFDSVSEYTSRQIEEFKDYLSEDQINKFRVMRSIPFYRTTVVFSDNVPRDRAYEVQEIITELQNNLEDIDSALLRLGHTDVKKKKEQIVDSMEFLSMLGALQQSILSSAEEEEPDEEEEEGDDSSDDKKSGKKSSVEVEKETGQPASRTEVQRQTKGKGNV